MARYQIEFNRGGGTKSFCYFDSENYAKGVSVESAAADVANEHMNKKKEMNTFLGWCSYKPPKSLSVREYDTTRKQPLRGGHKFKLRLTFLELITDSGRKERFESYEYND